jgi:glucoamylase
MTALAAWIEEQYPRSARAMLTAISPLTLVKERPAFRQRISAVRGAVVASPVLASYDPNPDYFFHWYRDSAIVIDALRLLCEDHLVGPEGLAILGDFVRFSASLDTLDGRPLVSAGQWRDGIDPKFAQYLREDADLAQVHGERVRGDVRVNPDGTLDITRWGRPQHDGIAMRALTLLRWRSAAQADRALSTDLAALLDADLTYVSRHALEPCIDIWEEEQGLHYYVLCVSAAALIDGAAWLAAGGPGSSASVEPLQPGGGLAPARAVGLHALGESLLKKLDGFWMDAEGYYRSRMLAGGKRSAKELDISVLLAVLHAGRTQGGHSPADPRVHGTLVRLASLFDAEYAINLRRPAGRGTAMGRYRGDVYYSGGAYYFSTLGAAELCYRAASALDAPDLTRQGDAYLSTVQAFTPASGELSEQFDRSTGVQTSAPQLAWSHAAFITCVHARRSAPAGA